MFTPPSDIQASIVNQATELLEEQWQEIKDKVDAAENSKAGFSLRCVLDFSDVRPMVTVTMVIPKSVKACRMERLGDPNQTEMPGTGPEETGRRKKGVAA